MIPSIKNCTNTNSFSLKKRHLIKSYSEIGWQGYLVIYFFDLQNYNSMSKSQVH